MLRKLCPFVCLSLLASSALGEVIELANGDRLDVTIVERTSESIIFTHPVLGDVTLPVDQVAVVDEVSLEAPQAAPVGVAPPDTEPQEKTEIVRKDPELFGIKFLPGWKRRFELGLDGSEGNSETFNFRAAFMGDYEDEGDRWHVGSAFVRQTTDGDKTRNDFFAEAIRDWLVPGEKHFYFAQTRYDYDDFQAWRQRAAVAGGVGYQFIKRDDFDLIGRAGAGANYTWGGDADPTVTPELLFGIEGAWRIDERQTFEFKNTIYPSLGQPGEYRNITNLAYVVTVDQVKGLSLKLGLENEYESVTDDDSEHNDLKYFVALVFEF